MAKKKKHNNKSNERRKRKRDASAILPVPSPTLARPLAPEDIRVGSFIAILHRVVLVPPWVWACHGLTPPSTALDPISMLWTPDPDEDAWPMWVEAVCLPFVVVTPASGGRLRWLDTRTVRLAEVDDAVGRAVFSRVSEKRGGDAADASPPWLRRQS
ncbi:MAG: hypothetical protein ACF8PN_06105 [Phycisphaerales bacterium]